MELCATLLGNHARNVRARARARRIHIRQLAAAHSPPYTQPAPRTQPALHTLPAPRTLPAHTNNPGLVPRGYGTRPGPGQRLSAGALTP